MFFDFKVLDMYEMSSFLKKIKLVGDNNKLYFNFFG